MAQLTCIHSRRSYRATAPLKAGIGAHNGFVSSQHTRSDVMMAPDRMFVRDLTPNLGARSRTILWTFLPGPGSRETSTWALRYPRHMSHVDRRSITQGLARAADR